MSGTDNIGIFDFDGTEGIAFWVDDSKYDRSVRVMFSDMEDLKQFLEANFPGLFPGSADSGLCGGCRDLGPHRNVPNCDFYDDLIEGSWWVVKHIPSFRVQILNVNTLYAHEGRLVRFRLSNGDIVVCTEASFRDAHRAEGE